MKPAFALLICLSCTLVPGEGSAQWRTRLQSRALFVALDSAAIEDSSAMRPLDAHQPLDSVMLEMVAFLDSAIGPAWGLPTTRIRQWDGFGSQAHPTLGILVDEEEIGTLIERVESMKGSAGVPPAEIERRLPNVVRFLIAHEYGHLIQYRRFGVEAVAAPNATRVIECGADLLGGMSYRTYLASRYPVGPLPAAAEETAIDFGYVVGAADWLDGTTHPLPEDRRACIRRGVDVSVALANRKLVQAGGADPALFASVRWLQENEPELYADQLDVLAWSEVRAKALASARAVVDSSAVLAVVRDSSVQRLVRRLADAAAKGEPTLRAFRSELAPGESDRWLLRESLAPPWQCTSGEVGGTETARCEQVVRTGRPVAWAVYEAMVTAVGEALNGLPWTQAQQEPVSGAVELGAAVFVSGDGDPKASKAARIRVSLAQAPGSMTMQMPPQSIIAIVVRARN
jgi:hypothetical protein